MVFEAVTTYIIIDGCSTLTSEDNIRMDLQEVGWGGMDWIDLVQDTDRCLALVSAVMNLRVP